MWKYFYKALLLIWKLFKILQTSAVSSSSGSTSWQKSEQSDDKQSCSVKNRERKK